MVGNKSDQNLIILICIVLFFRYNCMNDYSAGVTEVKNLMYLLNKYLNVKVYSLIPFLQFSYN